MGTICSTVLACTWYEPYSAFKYGLKASSKEFFKTLLQDFTVAGMSFLLLSLLDNLVLIQLDFIFGLIIKIVLYLTVLGSYVFLFRNHEGGKQIILMIQKVLKLKNKVVKI